VTAPADSAARPESWGEFMIAPAAYIDSSRLVPCFDSELSISLCERLTTSKRLRHRLSAIIHAHYSLGPFIPPEGCSDIDRAVALGPAAQLLILAERSGAIYWANTIANVILSRQVETLHQQLGEPLCGFALAHRDLSGPEQSLEPLHNVRARMVEDGWRCLSAWCQAVPAGVGARVRLKVAPMDALDRPPRGRFYEIGPSIVRRAAN
jgi:hypothetical protein